MDKVILVMNDPICCSNCPLSKYMRRHDTWVCGMPHSGGFDMIFEPVDMEVETRPNWCPLKPAPEEQLVWNDDDDWVMGYNNCVREIVGREEDYGRST